MNWKEYTIFIVGLAVAFFVAGAVLISVYGEEKTVDPIVGIGGQPNVPNFAVGSSTTFTLTTTSQRLLATTTSGNGRRVAALVQSTNCTAGNAIYLNVEGSDAVATANNGIAVVASTSQAFGAFPITPPISTNAIQGIAGGGTCTVLVTEWLTQ